MKLNINSTKSNFFPEKKGINLEQSLQKPQGFLFKREYLLNRKVKSNPRHVLIFQTCSQGKIVATLEPQ